MVCGIAAPGLALRAYFNRYTKDAIDLCDVLSSFGPQNKSSLHELCRVMGLPGKPDGIAGADVERYCREGRIAEVAAYGETDVVNTYRVWLRYELFRGRLSQPARATGAVHIGALPVSSQLRQRTGPDVAIGDTNRSCGNRRRLNRETTLRPYGTRDKGPAGRPRHASADDVRGFRQAPRR
jgi:hypothetical protein